MSQAEEKEVRIVSFKEDYSEHLLWLCLWNVTDRSQIGGRPKLLEDRKCCSFFMTGVCRPVKKIIQYNR